MNVYRFTSENIPNRTFAWTLTAFGLETELPPRFPRDGDPLNLS